MMSGYWSTLSQRERGLIIVGILSSLLIVFYFFILEPRYQRLSMLRAQVPSQADDLAWMRAQVRAYKPVLQEKNKQTSKPKAPLLTVIEQTANRAGLRTSITRMQPAENNQVRIWFDDIYFDPWLRWLEILKKQNIHVTAATVNKTKDRKVNIRVTLG